MSEPGAMRPVSASAGLAIMKRGPHAHDVAELEAEPVEQRWRRHRAPEPVAPGERIPERTSGLEPDAAIERIGVVHRLELDQAALGVVVPARHRAHPDHLRDAAVSIEILPLGL